MQAWLNTSQDERRRHVPDEPKQVLSGSLAMQWRDCLQHFTVPSVPAAESADDLGDGEAGLWAWICKELAPFPDGEWPQWGMNRMPCVAKVKQEPQHEPASPAMPAVLVKQELPASPPCMPCTPKRGRKKQDEQASALSPPRPVKACKREICDNASERLQPPGKSGKDGAGMAMMATCATVQGSSDSSGPCTEDVEAYLLRETVPEPLAREQMSYAQVLRGFLHIAKLHYGNGWPRRVGIILGSSEESMRALEHQREAPFLAVVVQSDTHWAVMMVSSAASAHGARAVLYDGKRDAQCQDLSVAVVAYLVESGFLAGAVTVEKARCSKQADNWSCGHRAVLFFEHCLCEVNKDRPLPVAVSGTISEDARIDFLISICNRGDGGSGGAGRAPVKRERCSSVPSVARDARASQQSKASKDSKASMACKAAKSVENAVKLSAPFAPVSAGHGLWAPKTLRPSQPRAITLEDDDDGEIGGLPISPPRLKHELSPQVTADGYAGTKLKRKKDPQTPDKSKKKANVAQNAQTAKKSRELQEGGRKSLREAELSHIDFQKRHREHQGPNTLASQPGHFQSFCEALARPDRILGCSACASLRQQVRDALASSGASGALASAQSPRVPSQSPQDPQVVQMVQQMQEQLPEEQDAQDIVVGDRVHNRGRRPKSEAPGARFDLHRFIQKERVGIYRATDKSYCGKLEYFCLACQKAVNMFTATNDSKLTGHEKGQKHQDGLKRLEAEEAQRKPEPRQQSVPRQEPEPSRPSQAESAMSAALVPVEVRDVHVCRGLSIEERNSPVSALRDSFQTFFQSGCPRTLFQRGETDPLEKVDFVYDGSVVRLRATDCNGRIEGHNARVKSCCGTCLRACGAGALRKHVAKKAYLLDLAHWSWQLFYASEAEAAATAERIRCADYKLMGFAGLDFPQLEEAESKISLARSIWNRFENIPKLRRSAALQNFMDRYLVRPQFYHSRDMEAHAHSALVAAFTQQVGSGQIQPADLQLASKVAAGDLRVDSLIGGLTSSFLFAYKKSLTNLKRKTTSAHMDPEALEDMLLTLGQRKEAQNLLQRFSVNPEMLPRLILHSQTLPNPFCSLREKAEVEQAAQRALSLLRVPGQRCHLVVDETCWSPGYEQISGLRIGSESSARELAVVGGQWSPDPAEDFSYLLCSKQPAMAELPKSKLARLTLHIGLKRVDNARYVFDIVAVPRPPGVADAAELLSMVAVSLEACTKVNNDVPPIGASHDGASNNVLLNRVQVGLETKKMRELPFFRECEVEDVDESRCPFWPYKQLSY